MDRYKLDVSRLSDNAKILLERQKWGDWYWWNHFATQQWRNDMITRLLMELRDLEWEWNRLWKNQHVKGTTANKYRERIFTREKHIHDSIREIELGEWDELSKKSSD